MIVLGIESSCDETAAALVRDDGLILSDVVASQIKLHAPYGGVVPELASRAHLTNLVPVIEQALAALPGGLDAVDAIAVTAGPGLVGALLVGVQAAKAMAWAKQKPLVGVDHLVGHLLAIYLRRELFVLGFRNPNYMKLVERFARRYLTSVVADPELPELLGLCDRIYTLAEGHITGEFVAAEATQELLMRHMTTSRR